MTGSRQRNKNKIAAAHERTLRERRRAEKKQAKREKGTGAAKAPEQEAKR